MFVGFIHLSVETLSVTICRLGEKLIALIQRVGRGQHEIRFVI